MKKLILILILVLIIVTVGLQAKPTDSVKLDSMIVNAIDIAMQSKIKNKTIYTYSSGIITYVIIKKNRTIIRIKKNNNVVIKIKYNHKSRLVRGFVSTEYNNTELISLLEKVIKLI
jgi:hypothetical protein